MEIKPKNELTIRRIEVICALIFLLNFLTPLQEILATNVYPSMIQLIRILITAIIQVVTLLMSLLQIKTPETITEDDSS